MFAVLKIEQRLSNLSFLYRGLQTGIKMSGPVESSIKSKLSTLNPEHLDVINESYMHGVPKGSESHFKVVVVSPAFENKPLIQRHRMVNDLLSEEFENGLHALSIVAKTPSQWSESDKKDVKCKGGNPAGLNGNTKSLQTAPIVVQRVDHVLNKSSKAVASNKPSDENLASNLTIPKEDSFPIVMKLLKPNVLSQLTSNSNEVSAKLDSKILKERLTNDSVDACYVKNSSQAPPKKVQDKELDVKSSEIKDGNYFLKLLDDNVIELNKIADECGSNEVNSNSEEFQGDLRALKGKARLLVSEKLNQFRGLCHKNLSNSKTDGYPTTNEDLAGFWDMVYIQVEDIFNTYKIMKDNNWSMPETKVEKETKLSRNKVPLKSKSVGNSVSRPLSANSELIKERDAQRKLMLQLRRQAMKQNATTS